MNKHFLTILTAVSAAVLLTGCGTGKTAKNGTYISVNGIRNLAAEYRTDPDAALEAVLAEEIDSEATVALNQDNSFSVTRYLSSNQAVTWNGTYSTDQSALKFSYTGAEVTGNADPARFTDRIASLNEAGEYPDTVAPRIYMADVAKTCSGLPIGILRGTEAEAPSDAELHGDFLCVPMYGLTTDGTYQSGKDFALNYVPADTLRDDRYSRAYYNDTEMTYSQQLNTEKLDIELRILANRYGIENSENMQFRLTFSGGKWTMTGADGSPFSHGAYAESKQHPGFISMYEEPDDPGAKSVLDNLYPLFLYIDSSTGRICYPGFVRKP